MSDIAACLTAYYAALTREACEAVHPGDCRVGGTVREDGLGTAYLPTRVRPRVRAIYNILFTTFFILASPYYFWRMRRRGNWLEGFFQRFGAYDVKIKQSVTNRHVIWLHAVSVGEVNICTQLIRSLEPRLPNVKVIVSTTTTTGMSELRRKLPTHITKVYYPIDRRRYVARAMSTLRPRAIVLVEAEIWPNFIWRARQVGIPIFLVNARLSNRSYRRYRLFGFLFRSIFASFTGVGAQNEADAARLRTLGCRPEAIHVVGSLKYDAARIEERRALDVPAMLAQLGVPPDAQLLVGGSTHPGEEGTLAEVFLKLKPRFPRLFLILVPRHFERSREVGRDLEARKVKFAYRSEITAHTKHTPADIDCLLVNTTGELKYFYEPAAVIFVGKSLTAQGGQNPIEPGALGKPILFGPHMQNFAEIAQSFVANDGAVQVKDAADLEIQLAALLADPTRCAQLGQNAVKVVRENLGAVERTVAMILDQMDLEEHYLAPAK